MPNVFDDLLYHVYVTRFESWKPFRQECHSRRTREETKPKKEEERGGKQNKTTSTVLTVASRTVSERRWSRNGNEAGIVLAKTCDMRWNSHYLPTETSHGCYNNDQGTAFLWKCRAVQSWKTWLVPVISHRRLFFSAIIWFVFLLIAVSGKGKPQRRKTERAWIEEADKGRDDTIKKNREKSTGDQTNWDSCECEYLYMHSYRFQQLQQVSTNAGYFGRKEGIQVDLLTNTVRCQSVGASSELELVQPHATWATDRWPFHYYYRCRCSGRGCRPSRATLQSHSPDSARKCRAAATIQ